MATKKTNAEKTQEQIENKQVTQLAIADADEMIQQGPVLFKISSIADTGLSIRPKSIIREGGYVKLTCIVNGVDQTISVEDRKVSAEFDIHWANLSASLINKLDCRDFADEKNTVLKKLSITYGKNRSISTVFLVPRDKFQESLELHIKKLAWYSDSQLEDMADQDPEDQAASTLTLEEANLMNNLTSDTKKIMQEYPKMINVLEQVDSGTIQEIAADIEYRKSHPQLVAVNPEQE